MGITLVTIDRWTLAEDLWSFGEDELYPAALDLSDDEMVRLWKLAGRLYLRDEARCGGEASALAAVSILEGERRPLARTRRRPGRGRPELGRSVEERIADVHRIEESDSYPAPWQ